MCMTQWVGQGNARRKIALSTRCGAPGGCQPPVLSYMTLQAITLCTVCAIAASNVTTRALSQILITLAYILNCGHPVDALHQDANHWEVERLYRRCAGFRARQNAPHRFIFQAIALLYTAVVVDRPPTEYEAQTKAYRRSGIRCSFGDCGDMGGYRLLPQAAIQPLGPLPEHVSKKLKSIHKGSSLQLTRNDLPIVHNGYRPTLSSPSKRAIVSSLYSDSYSIAVSVLAHSIRRANMTTPLLLPYLEGRVSSQALCITRAAGWTAIPIPYIAPPDNGAGVHERFKDQFTKLNIWGLDAHGIDRAVYLDADTLVRRSFDELFELPFEFAAVPDVYNGNRGFTIAFNAGVLAIRPSTPVLRTMMREIATAEYPRHEAEQSFLNLFFGAKALRLPYVYNANLAIKDRSPVLWDSMKGEMRIVHYTLVKPFTDDMMYAGPIRTIEEQRRVLDKTAKQFGGLFADEVGWWRQAFEDMIEDVGDAIQNCYPR